MKLRQSREQGVLQRSRLLYPGEIDHLIDRNGLFEAPEPAWTQDILNQCEAIYERMPNDVAIPDQWFSDIEKWVFLEYVLHFRHILLVGSNEANVERLAPLRLSSNLDGWNRPRYFAFASSIEAIFHAVLDSSRLTSLDCPTQCTVSLPFTGINEQPKQFYIGLDYRALPEGLWRHGTVYLYRAFDFPGDYIDRPFWTEEPIRPLARLNVGPLDWPMLGHVSGIDLVSQTKRQWDTYAGFPWPNDQDIHPHLWKRPLATVIKEHLDAEFVAPIHLKDLAKFVGASPFGVLRLFQAVFGVSPYEYQAELRVQSAKRMLKEGAAIADVAAECGFCDQTHLNRHFRRRLGTTPGQFLRAQDNPIRMA